MSRIGKVAFGVVLGALLLAGVGGAVAPVYAQEQAQKPAYTTEEYNAYIKAHNETDPQQKIKLLDDFVAKYSQFGAGSSTSITTTTRLITR